LLAQARGRAKHERLDQRGRQVGTPEQQVERSDRLTRPREVALLRQACAELVAHLQGFAEVLAPAQGVDQVAQHDGGVGRRDRGPRRRFPGLTHDTQCRSRIALAHVLHGLGRAHDGPGGLVVLGGEQWQHALLFAQRQACLPAQAQHERHRRRQRGGAARVSGIAQQAFAGGEVLQCVVETAIGRGAVGDGIAALGLDPPVAQHDRIAEQARDLGQAGLDLAGRGPHHGRHQAHPQLVGLAAGEKTQLVQA
jgi:hypothetical protein